MKSAIDSLHLAGVIFDLDGVLVDSEPLHARTWIEVLRPCGYNVDERWFDQWIGISDEDLAEHLAAGKFIAVAAEEILRRKRRAFQEAVSAGHLPAFAGVRRGLERLSAAGIPMAVASNSRTETVAHALAVTGLAPFFAAVVGVDQVKRGKPAPDAFCEAARQLGVAACDCAAVEDSPPGVAAAVAAKCRVYAVTTTHPPERLEQAHKVLSSTDEAIGLILDDYAISSTPTAARGKMTRAKLEKLNTARQA